MPVCRNDDTRELRSFREPPDGWTVVPGCRESIRLGFVDENNDPWVEPRAVIDAEAFVTQHEVAPD